MVVHRAADGSGRMCCEAATRPAHTAPGSLSRDARARVSVIACRLFSSSENSTRRRPTASICAIQEPQERSRISATCSLARRSLDVVRPSGRPAQPTINQALRPEVLDDRHPPGGEVEKHRQPRHSPENDAMRGRYGAHNLRIIQTIHAAGDHDCDPSSGMARAQQGEWSQGGS